MNVAEMSKNKTKKANYLVDSLKFLQYATTFNGLLPFYVDGKTVRIRSVLMIMAVIHYVFYITCLALSLDEGDKLGQSFFQSELTNFVFSVQGVSSIICVTFVFTLGLLRRRYLLKSLQQFVEMDIRFQNITVILKYNQVTKLTVKLLLTMIVYLTVFHTVNILLFEPIRNTSFTMHVTFVLPSLYIWMIVIVYVTIVCMIKISLKEINKVIWF